MIRVERKVSNLVVFVQNFAAQSDRARPDREARLGLRSHQPGENTEDPNQENVEELSIKTIRQ